MSKQKKSGLKYQLKELGLFLKHVFREWHDDGTHRLGAGIAYYGTIALFPYLVFIFILAAIVFTPQEIVNTLADFGEQLFGAEAFDATRVRDINVQGIDGGSGSNAIGILGLGSFIVAGAFSVVAIQDAINVIWKSKKKLKFSVSRYLLAFVVMLAGAATFTGAVGIRVILGALRDSFPSNEFVVSWLFTLATSFAFLTLLTLFFMMLYRLLVKVSVDKVSLFVSGLVTASFLMAGQYALSVYLTNFVDFSYLGAIGAYFVLLITIYYIAQIFLIGAQTGKVLSYRHGNKHLKPLLEETDPRFDKKSSKKSKE